MTVPPPAIEPEDQARAQRNRARRLATYQQVWELHSSGWTNKAIAQHLGIGAMTVYRYLLSPTFVERREREDRGSSHLDPYKLYLLERWNSGCHQARVLFEEPKAQGCLSSYSSVARYVRCLKEDLGLQNRQSGSSSSQSKLTKSQQRSLTPRRATWLALRRQDHRAEGDEQRLAQLQSQCPALSDHSSSGFCPDGT